MVADGHELANHTMHDMPSFRLPLAELESQIDACEALLERACPGKARHRPGSSPTSTSAATGATGSGACPEKRADPLPVACTCLFSQGSLPSQDNFGSPMVLSSSSHFLRSRVPFPSPRASNPSPPAPPPLPSPPASHPTSASSSPLPCPPLLSPLCVLLSPAGGYTLILFLPISPPSAVSLATDPTLTRLTLPST